MKEKMTVVQLRSTIFLQQNIGYTPENAEQFKQLLMPDCKIYGIAPAGVPMLGVNPAMPMYGMPWRLFKKIDNGDEYNIAFQPGKIDIVLAKEEVYGSNIEKIFCDQSIKWFTSILETQGDMQVTRIAYAPLYAIFKDKDQNSDAIWNLWLKKTVFDGVQSKDINLSFLLKRLIKFGDTEIQMNLLHNIFDGKQTRNDNDLQTVRDVLLLQLDLNSVPDKILSLGIEGVSSFFNGILDIKNKLVDNVTA